jgi:uncharacterized integral membrane protein
VAGDDDASEPARAKPGPGKGFPPWLVAVIIVGIVSVVFIMQNRTRVKVHFILFDRQARTWVVILISMALGALLAEVVRLAVKRRRGAQVSRPDST